MLHFQYRIFLQRLKFILLCISLPLAYINAQQTEISPYKKLNDLKQFSKIKAKNWKLEKNKADSLAKLLNIPIEYIDHNNKVLVLQYLGRKNKPVYYTTDNIDAARTISTDQVWTDDNNNPYLTGEGIDINLWDGGLVLSTHQEFQNGFETRIVMREKDISLSNHSTHIAGTMAASGVDENARGMADLATVYGWDFNNDIAEMSIAASEEIRVSNHSYGPICGWHYSSSPVLAWYWYGEPDISPLEDYKFGFYDQVSADLDYIAWCSPNYLIVKSAGNDRNDAPVNQPVDHYVWNNNWEFISDVVRNADGGLEGYDCLTPMSVSKNILTIGAVDNEKTITTFSAFGPTDDGRIKPDVVANGMDIYSSIATSSSSYDSYSGTSMAAPSATGSIALLHHLQKKLLPGIPLLSSTIKALLIHTAEDSGNSTGPDYRFGWGLLNIKEACDLIKANSQNGGKNIHEGILSQENEIIIPIETTVNTPVLKVTICWTDPAGQASSPSLDSRDTKLVNDLDIEVENTDNHQIYLPWILDVENPELPATHGVNHTDNVEQIYIINPDPGNFNVKISHSGILSGDSQAFSLIISGISTPINIFPPQNLQFSATESVILLKWNSPEIATPLFYKIYRNGVFLAESVDTFYYDQTVTTDNTYDYFVTAVYNWNNNEIESLETNHITASPKILKSLPFMIDFEEETTDILYKSNENGWRRGDSESLNCYYLNFDSNTTMFIGIDSYSTGETSHVNDIATTVPLKLAEYTDITLSFDYMLITGIYNAIDEFHVVYKLQEEDEWTEWENLPAAFNWSTYSLSLPDEAYKNGIQIGFYYDDFYQWGMGSGLDNIQITGTPIRSFDLAITSMNSPVSACMLSQTENITIAIQNTGEQDALPGDIINIEMNVSSGVNIVEHLVLSEPLNSGDIIAHQMSESVDLSIPDTYIFDFTLSSSHDHNELNNFHNTSVEVYGLPVTQILNTDVSFCENESPVLVEVSPVGGTLTGIGVTELYFDPEQAGHGTHLLTYSFVDKNGCEGTDVVEFLVTSIPEPEILNPNLSFCENEEQVLIQVHPTGGTLSGTGVSGLYFDPVTAEVGTHIVSYTFMDDNGCIEVCEKPFIVLENPVVNLGPDLFANLNDTIKLLPAGNGASFLWYNGSTDNYLELIAKDLGIGIHDIWILATSIQNCSSIDSILITIENANLIHEKNTPFDPFVYPNPFYEGFYIKLDKQEKLENIFLYGQSGLVILNNRFNANHYFDVSDLSPGIYILQIQTSKRTLNLKVLKIKN